MGWRSDAARAELAATRRRNEVEEAELFGEPGEAQAVIAELEAKGFGPDGYPLAK